MKILFSTPPIFYTKLVEQNSFTPTAPQQMNNPIYPQSSRSATTKKIILSLVTLLLILVIGGLSWQRFATQRNKQNSPVNKTTENLYSIKVGNELIYKEDITKMISLGLVASPSATQLELEKLAQGKIIYESIILQGAETDGLTTLDNTVFNSPNKDLNKRQQLVEQAQNTIEQQSEGIHGMVIILWFNNSNPSLGYEKAKELAYTKMNNLHNMVKSKQITIEQAVSEIQNDASLAQINANYKVNTSMKVEPYPGPNITYFPKFDAMLRSLKEGEITDLYLATDSEEQQPLQGNQATPTPKKDIPSVYMFGQINKIVVGGTPINFLDWYDQKQKQYEVKYY